jgi:FtsH-binding integral membrane protein
MCPRAGHAPRERERAVDINKLNTGEKVMGISGIALLIFSFFPWLGYSYANISASYSAWHFTLGWIAVVLGVVLAGLVIAKAAGADIPALGNLKWAHVFLAVTALVFVLIVIKVIAGPGTGGVSVPGLSKDRKIGIFLGIIASAGLMVGAYLNAKETGDLPGALGGAKGGSAPPPPPTA